MAQETPAQRLIYARTLAGYPTASEAARANGWNENTYRSHENGERGLKWAVVTKYAAAFKVPAIYILSGDMGVSRTLMVPIAGFVSSTGSNWLYEEVISGSKVGRTAGLMVEVRRQSFAVAVDKDGAPLGLMPDSALICYKDPYGIKDSIESLCVIKDEDDKITVATPAEGDSDMTIKILTPAMNFKLIKPKAIWGVYLIIPPRQWRALEMPLKPQ